MLGARGWDTKVPWATKDRKLGLSTRRRIFRSSSLSQDKFIPARGNGPAKIHEFQRGDSAPGVDQTGVGKKARLEIARNELRKAFDYRTLGAVIERQQRGAGRKRAVPHCR